MCSRVEKNITLLPIRHLKGRESEPCTFYPGLFVYDSTGETINMFTTKQNYVYVTDSEECTGYEIIIIAINPIDQMKFTCICSTRITNLETVNEIVESIINDLLYGNHSSNMIYLSNVHYRVLHFSKIDNSSECHEEKLQSPIILGNEHVLSPILCEKSGNKESNEKNESVENSESKENEKEVTVKGEYGVENKISNKKHVILQIPQLQQESIIVNNEKDINSEENNEYDKKDYLELSGNESPKFKPLIQRNSISTPEEYKNYLEVLEPEIIDYEIKKDFHNDRIVKQGLSESKSMNDLIISSLDNENKRDFNDQKNTMIIMNARDCMRSKSSIDQFIIHSKL